MQWLLTAERERDPQLIFVNFWPMFSCVWEHKEYADLLRRLNLPQRGVEA